MKIYLSHAGNSDYINQLYNPIKESDLNKENEFFFPHENSHSRKTKDTIKNSDLLLAEVSFPSTGQGIELGWAENFNVPILCIYKKEAKFSSSLKYVTKNFIEYSDKKDFVSQLRTFLSRK